MLVLSSEFLTDVDIFWRLSTALVFFGMLQSNLLFAGEILGGFGIYLHVLTSSVLFQPVHVDFGSFRHFSVVLLCFRPVQFFFYQFDGFMAGFVVFSAGSCFSTNSIIFQPSLCQ